MQGKTQTRPNEGLLSNRFLFRFLKLRDTFYEAPKMHRFLPVVSGPRRLIHSESDAKHYADLVRIADVGIC